ncbi:MAG: hypothetical protein NTX50_26180 [Candidatus Sumerlaeota bacterium]|nr:hypothetical protein [Candidatus Sumerlaeota bacterium]
MVEPPVGAAQITLALLAGIAVEALRRSDGRAALMAVATLGAGVAIINGLAPISVKNDRFASLSLFLGFTLALDVLSALRNSAKAQKIWQRMAVAGFFLGMAAAAKPLAIGFCLPMTVIFFFATGWSSQRPRSAAQAADAHHSFSIAVLISRFDLAFALRIGAALAAGAAAAYAPWAIRGIRAGGDPYFPLGAALFPIRSEYLPAYAIVRQTNPLYEFSLSGLSHALGSDLIEKIYRGMASGDFMLLLFIGAALAALASRDPLRRIQGLILASFAPVYIAMHGGIEVNRYFSIGYSAAAGAFGGMFGGISAHLGPKGRAALIGMLLALCGGSYVKRQYNFAHFDVIQWRYRPIVTQAERRALAERAQLAEYDIFDAARPLIESDAGVLLPDCWQPFYLRRRCVWGDQAFHLDQPNALPWMRKGPQAQEETRRLIKEKDLRYVLLMDRKNSGLFERLAESGFLVSVPLPFSATGVPPSWTLYRVASGAGIKKKT